MIVCDRCGMQSTYPAHRTFTRPGVCDESVFVDINRDYCQPCLRVVCNLIEDALDSVLKPAHVEHDG